MNLKNSRGFTLLELLISITLSVTIIVILFAGLRLGYKSMEKGTEREETAQRMRILGDRISWLLRGAYPYIRSIPEGKMLYFKGESDSVGFVTSSVDTPAEGPEDSAGLKWVYLWVDSDGLKLREAVFFLEDVMEDDIGTVYTLDPKVKDLKIEYFKITEGETEGEWESEWESKDKDSLPSAVKVKLTFLINEKEIQMPEIIVRINAVLKQ
jgi:prepilin-type N-terminal cleavage/methylation domain-containing protein